MVPLLNPMKLPLGYGEKKELDMVSIYSPKGLNIAKRLHGHQNILRVEMIAIHKTLRIMNTQYPNESAFIFTNSLNVLYLLNTQIKHPPFIIAT